MEVCSVNIDQPARRRIAFLVVASANDLVDETKHQQKDWNQNQ
jgi:hypothetical protein